jgi:hypothetical protein
MSNPSTNTTKALIKGEILIIKTIVYEMLYQPQSPTTQVNNLERVRNKLEIIEKEVEKLSCPINTQGS